MIHNYESFGSNDTGRQGLMPFNTVNITRRSILVGGALAIASGALAACSDERSEQPEQGAPVDSPDPVEQTPPAAATEGLEKNPAAKDTAARIISTFENSTTEIQYAYAERLGDGRGITAGRAGFTSGTSDLLLVVDRYVGASPDDNPLEKYLPALQRIEDEKTDDGMNPSVEGLDGFEEAWREASEAEDGILNRIQDEAVEEVYFIPAMHEAKASNVTSPLGQLIFWDTIIQHGGGNDPDSMGAIVLENTKLTGTPDNSAAESVWLGSLLEVRRNHLMNAADPSTREAWQDSVSRVDALKSILDSGNMELKRPLTWDVYGDTFALR